MADSTSFVARMSKEDEPDDIHRRQRQEGQARWTEIWDDATKMQKFANGDQWPEGDKKVLDQQGARKVARITADEVGVIVQTLAGRQVMQRFERGYIARHPSFARQAEIMTAIDHAMMHAADAEQVESAAFKDGPGIQGVSVVRWELDTLGERGGGLILTDLPVWQVMADPEARQVNLMDRSWHAYGKWYPQAEVRRRWPEQYEKIKGKYGGQSWNPKDTGGGQSSRVPWTGMGGNKPLQPYYPKGQTLWIEYKEWRQIESEWEVGKPAVPGMTYADAMMQDPSMGDPLTTVTYKSKAEVDKCKAEHLALTGEDVPKEMIAEKQVLRYYYAYLCGDVVMEQGEIPTGYWTIQFLTGFRFPLADKVKWRSLVSRLIDPQKWVNVMLSALIRNIQINPKGLLFVEEGFFANHNEAMSAWASPGGLIRVRRGALSTGQKGYEWVSGGTSPYAQMVESMMSFWREAIPRYAGFNPGALGQLGNDLRRISGEVVRQVQDAAMTSNAELFDALRLHRREGGRIFLSFLRKFFEMEDIIRIVGDDVAYETRMEPVPDPMTGQPAHDPMTGEVLMKPVYGPDGQPVKDLVVPPKEAWTPDWWKEISVEDQMPTGDQLQALWKSVETSIQILLQPQPDTGQPLFNSEDLADIIPGIPEQRREKMRQRIKAALLAKQQQQWAAAQAGQGGGDQGGDQGGGGQPTAAPPQAA